MQPLKSISIGLTIVPPTALSGFMLESLVTVMEDGMQSAALLLMGTEAAAVIEYSTSAVAGAAMRTAPYPPFLPES